MLLMYLLLRSNKVFQTHGLPVVYKKYSFASFRKALKARQKFLWFLFHKVLFFPCEWQPEPFYFQTRLCSKVTSFCGEHIDMSPGMALLGDPLSHPDVRSCSATSHSLNITHTGGDEHHGDCPPYWWDISKCQN